MQDSLRFEGAEPNPVELKVEFGKVIAKYLDIADRKERSIIFKAKVKETVETGEKIRIKRLRRYNKSTRRTGCFNHTAV